MKKFIITVILFFATFLPVYTQTVLYGGTEYNVESARGTVTDGVVYRINPSTYKDKLFDYDNTTNLQNIVDGNLELKDRTLAFFSDSTYGILFKDDPYNVYYYSAEGLLLYIDQKSSLEYPYKFYKYSSAGELINMGLRISKGETYIYSPDEKLIAHWVGANAYDENNNLVMKRRYSE